MTAATDTPPPGHRLDLEMRQQPEVLAALAGRRDHLAEDVASVLPERLHGVMLVARGSSDHAAVYGRYVVQYVTGLPVVMAAPSLHTRYERRGRLDGHLAVGVSQSGRTPEIVETLAAMGAAGATTIAITNDAASDLARAATATLALDTGDELAVPATKTLTAQLAMFAHLAAALGEVPWRAADWDAVVTAVATVLDDTAPVAELAERLGEVDQLLTVGRGFLYAAALETALKIAETTGIHTSGFSSADLLHGPIAVASPDHHALCLVADGPVAQDLRDVADELARRGTTVHAITDGTPIPAAASALAHPAVCEPLAPLVAVVRGQQLAQHLALDRGIDPDQPRGLRKVTPTT